MSTSYLLDSSVLVLSLKQDKATHQHLADAAALYVSTVALGELYYGAEHSVHVKKSLAARDHHFTWIDRLILEQW
jgi:predicted nucleic acid-binding protein